MATSPRGGGKTTGKFHTATTSSGSAAGNRGDDKREGDKIGPGTFADDGAEPAKVTRGAPPKPVKRYSHAD